VAQVTIIAYAAVCHVYKNSVMVSVTLFWEPVLHHVPLMFAVPINCTGPRNIEETALRYF
jgi:hypothetical protein